MDVSIEDISRVVRLVQEVCDRWDDPRVWREKRLRETLSLLLDGRSEKEVAAALHLGSRTVHDCVTALYEHFRVSSRAELLAYSIRRQPVLRAAPST